MRKYGASNDTNISRHFATKDGIKERQNIFVCLKKTVIILRTASLEENCVCHTNTQETKEIHF